MFKKLMKLFYAIACKSCQFLGQNRTKQKKLPVHYFLPIIVILLASALIQKHNFCLNASFDAIEGVSELLSDCKGSSRPNSWKFCRCIVCAFHFSTMLLFLSLKCFNVNIFIALLFELTDAKVYMKCDDCNAWAWKTNMFQTFSEILYCCGWNRKK